MALKIFVLGLCVTVISTVAVAEPREEQSEADNFDPHPIYSFNYEVLDASSGDFKSQFESRDGDVVRGEYSLQDADGYRRVVKYSADAESGFRAEVHRHRLDSALLKSPPKPKLQPPPLPAIKPAKFQNPTLYKAPAVRTYKVPTLIHHSPSHTVIHHTPAVQLTSLHGGARTFVHTAPIVHLTAPTVLRAGSTVITHHHGPAAIVKTSLTSPHYSYIY